MNTDSTQPTPLIGNAESVEPDEAPTECFAEPDGDKAVLGTPTPDEEQTTYPDVDAIGVHEAPPQDTCEAAPDGTPPGDVLGCA